MKYETWVKKKEKELVQEAGLDLATAREIIEKYGVSEIQTIVKFMKDYGEILGKTESRKAN